MGKNPALYQLLVVSLRDQFWGPLLFSIFINDLPSIVSSPTFLFADDTKIFQVIRNEEDHLALQKDLNLLHEWSLRWQLNFNVAKCKHLHFGTAHSYGSFTLMVLWSTV